MSESIPIVVREGESLDQATTRTLQERVKQVQAAQKKSRPKKVTVSDPAAGESIRADVAGAFHVYNRDGEPETMTRAIGTRYRTEFGPSVLVFVHLHPFGASCSPTCKERVCEAE